MQPESCLAILAVILLINTVFCNTVNTPENDVIVATYKDLDKAVNKMFQDRYEKIERFEADLMASIPKSEYDAWLLRMTHATDEMQQALSDPNIFSKAPAFKSFEELMYQMQQSGRNSEDPNVVVKKGLELYGPLREDLRTTAKELISTFVVFTKPLRNFSQETKDKNTKLLALSVAAEQDSYLYLDIFDFIQRYVEARAESLEAL